MNITHRPYADLQLRAATFENPRRRSGLDRESLVELALHIGRYGLEYPLRVTPAGVITGGQRRYLAIGMLLDWREHLLDHVLAQEHALFDMRGSLLRGSISCVLEEEEDQRKLRGKALADNLLRENMHTYDIAQDVVQMRKGSDGEPPMTMTMIAELIGRSLSYVSKMITAWETGKIPYDQVTALCHLSYEEQRAAIANPKPRGPHGRPGIDTIKNLLARTVKRRDVAEETLRAELAMHDVGAGRGREYYRQGLIDALRVATGETEIDAIETLLE